MELIKGTIQPVGLRNIPGTPEEGVANAAPAYQDKVFLVMWQSSLSGGTYSCVRKSVQSLNKFINTLDDYGYDMSLVTVIEQQKPWVLKKKKELTPLEKQRKKAEAKKNKKISALLR